MTDYFYMPQRYVKSGQWMYTTTWWDEGGNEYPHLPTLDEAIDYMNDRGIYGQVQRYAKYPVKHPGPKPNSRDNPGYSLWWSIQMSDYERGYGFYTAGVAWTSLDPAVSLMQVFTNKQKEYKGGILWEEIPGAADEICEYQEKVDRNDD